jgi:hypothetical protein
MRLAIRFLGVLISLATVVATEAGAQSQPAVDGPNAKFTGFGGGASGDGFYGAVGSLSLPIANQWGVQVDLGGVGANRASALGSAGHLFWRDPSVGLLGIYGSYSRWNVDHIGAVGTISATVGRFAAAGEYYRERWTVSAYAGVETVRVSGPASPYVQAAIPNRFFDSITVSYYPTPNIKLSLGQLYIFGRNGLSWGGEYGVPLGGGRMASVFAGGLLHEGGHATVLAGLRLYLGQRDKSLMDRHRQDDPEGPTGLPTAPTGPTGPVDTPGLPTCPTGC